MTKFYGKAGVRLSDSEARSRANRRRARAEAERVRAARRHAEDEDRWSRGLVRPHRITTALDAAGLYGPAVDAACGATEPEVDWWEAGVLYPTWDQLVRLAEICGVTPGYFTFDHRGGEIGTAIMCGPDGCQVTEPSERIESFDLGIVAACPGTRPDQHGARS